jgi:hypothetical protein
MEAEKWELEQDLLGSMMNNAWGKADAESSEIQLHKKKIGDFFDHLLIKLKVSDIPTSPRVSRRKLVIVSALILKSNINWKNLKCRGSPQASWRKLSGNDASKEYTRNMNASGNYSED